MRHSIPGRSCCFILCDFNFVLMNFNDSINKGIDLHETKKI